MSTANIFDKTTPSTVPIHCDLTIDAGSCSAKGSRRANNEDCYYVDPERRVFVVADGMGGMCAGEKASQLACERLPLQLKPLASHDQNDDSVRSVFGDAIHAVNDEIRFLGQREDCDRGTGTTVVVAVRVRDRLYVAWLGDSRAYLLRDGVVRQCTVDHSVAQFLVEQGVISQQAARHHNWRRMLWKYLGSKDLTGGPDLDVISMRPGDRLVLATDGLTNVLDNRAIAGLLTSNDSPSTAAVALVEAALDNDTHDDATCVTLFVEPTGL